MHRRVMLHRHDKKKNTNAMLRKGKENNRKMSRKGYETAAASRWEKEIENGEIGKIRWVHDMT